MEWYDYLKDKWNLDIIIIAIVFLSGFFQEKYLIDFKWAKDARFDASLKTLVVSLIASSIYILLMYRDAKHQSDGAAVFIPYGKYFISFFMATSLYDMGIRPLRKWIKNKLGEKDTEPGN